MILFRVVLSDGPYSDYEYLVWAENAGKAHRLAMECYRSDINIHRELLVMDTDVIKRGEGAHVAFSVFIGE